MAVAPKSSSGGSKSTNYTIQLLDKLAAGGQRDAIVHGKRRISSLEARSTILRFAHALSDNGVGESDGVAVFVANSPEPLLLKIAIHFVGGRLVFVPPTRANAELGAFIERPDVKMLVFDPGLGERAAELAKEAQVSAVFSLGVADGVPDFPHEASLRAERAPADAGDGSAVCTLLYTGGTTGSPKMVTHRPRGSRTSSPSPTRARPPRHPGCARRSTGSVPSCTSTTALPSRAS